MPTLLHIDSSPMAEASISRRLTGEFARLWRAANPEAKVIYRDLTTITLPVIDAPWVTANYTPKEMRTPEQHERLALSTELTRELLDADEYVLGVPMHNWGPSSLFKLWADQIVRFGETVLITPSGMKGTLDQKRLTVFMAAGRRYGNGFEDISRNHLEPWLHTFFSNLGVRNMRLVFADGSAKIRSGRIDQENFLAPHLAGIHALFENSVSA